MHDEETVWLEAKPEDLWLFDKLIVARKMGYVCGPAGVAVPKPGNYIVRPCVNALGMGRGAAVRWIDEDTDDLPPGSFWCEILEGRHLSVDYCRGIQVLCVEGSRFELEPFYKWSSWKKTGDVVLCPEWLRKYPYVNCEYVGGNLIEVHLRHNPDFVQYNVDELIPVWKGESTTPPKDYRFIPDEDFHRTGFFTKD